MDVFDRTLPTTRRVLGDVDLAQPLDTTHPLTDGLQGFWLPLPHLIGGSRLYDLSVRGNHGDFVDMSSSAWTAVPRVQHPVLEIAQSSDVVDTGFDEEVPQQFTTWMYVKGDLGSSDDRYVYARDNATFAGYTWRWDNGGWDVRNNADLGVGSFDESRFNLFVGTFNRNGEQRVYTNSDLVNSTAASGDLQQPRANVYIGGRAGGGADDHVFAAVGYAYVEYTQADVDMLYDQARRGFPGLLRRRDSVGLLGGGGGGPSPISGTAAITDAQEQISATGQTEVSGTLFVTDLSEMLMVDGAVITTGTAQITDAGEIISAVSSLQDITGTAQITDASEQVDATGEVKIAGTASLADGTEEVVIIGQNDVTGSLSFADLAAEIAAGGAVEVQGSLALTDLGESITARERVPARLATVDVRLEDIIIVHAQLTD